jgi:uncharacterized protein with PCYCGC motif
MSAIVAAAALSVASCRSDTPPPASSAPAPASPPQVASTRQPEPEIPFSRPPAPYNGALPPLPLAQFPPARPPEVVQAVYTFAARHPDVLHYVPCFCGCQRSGHKDNHDCFISGRDADGKPVWEPHGMT